MSVNPPAMATWLLKHLVLGERNEALQGDLLEEFQRRRSTSWYWRQVLEAILSFSNLLRAAWVTVWTVIFAGAWVYGLWAIVSMNTHSPLPTTGGIWIPYGDPVAIPYILYASVFYLAMPLFLHLVAVRNLSLRAFAVGLGAGVMVALLLVIVALPFFPFHLATPMNYVLEYGRAKHMNVIMWLRCFAVLQGAVPLLAAMWAAALNKTNWIFERRKRS